MINDKILHVSVVRKLTQGQKKQLEFEVEAGKGIISNSWGTMVYCCEKSGFENEVLIPRIFRGILFRGLYVGYKLFRLRRAYDVFLVRYMVLNFLGCFWFFLIGKVMTVHHAIEPEELKIVRQGFLGSILSRIEILSGFLSISCSKGVIGVTKEIALFESYRGIGDKPNAVYANGIDSSRIDLLSDKRSDTSIELVFICGVFSFWHGLEKFFDVAENESWHEHRIKVSLIGELNNSQVKRIENSLILSKVFRICGTLNFEDYSEILAAADIGISSFALDEKGLKEASTLKVREYLASGLPVYSGHVDSSFPENFDFYLMEKHPSLAGILDFSKKMKLITRESVRNESLKWIEKEEIMRRLICWLGEIK